MIEKTKEIYKEINADYILIPDGCTNHVQPLEAIVMSNFKRMQNSLE